MLRDPMGGRISAQNRLEQMAGDRVLDDQLMRRDLEREPFHHCTKQPRWCPEGLTKSQKRRVQRLHQLEILEEEKKQPFSQKGVKSQVWLLSPKPMMNNVLARRL